MHCWRHALFVTGVYEIRFSSPGIKIFIQSCATQVTKTGKNSIPQLPFSWKRALFSTLFYARFRRPGKRKWLTCWKRSEIRFPDILYPDAMLEKERFWLDEASNPKRQKTNGTWDEAELKEVLKLFSFALSHPECEVLCLCSMYLVYKITGLS